MAMTIPKALGLSLLAALCAATAANTAAVPKQNPCTASSFGVYVGATLAGGPYPSHDSPVTHTNGSVAVQCAYPADSLKIRFPGHVLASVSGCGGLIFVCTSCKLAGDTIACALNPKRETQRFSAAGTWEADAQWILANRDRAPTSCPHVFVTLMDRGVVTFTGSAASRCLGGVISIP